MTAAAQGRGEAVQPQVTLVHPPVMASRTMLVEQGLHPHGIERAGGGQARLFQSQEVPHREGEGGPERHRDADPKPGQYQHAGEIAPCGQPACPVRIGGGHGYARSSGMMRAAFTPVSFWFRP